MPTPTFDGEVYDDQQQYKDDNKLFAQFFTQAVKNETKSLVEGRPIFDEKVLIRILTPGSRDVMVTTASEQYRMRFPKQWERFKMKHSQTQDGTPLEEVPFLTVGQIAELKGVNVHTLEQLAGMSDVLAQKFMGSHQLRQRAQAFLQAAKESAPVQQLQAELEKRDNEIELLKSQVNQLIAAQEAKQSKPVQVHTRADLAA